LEFNEAGHTRPLVTFEAEKLIFPPQFNFEEFEKLDIFAFII
jgi:hypothetical protein